jgi:hypothetical protein
MIPVILVLVPVQVCNLEKPFNDTGFGFVEERKIFVGINHFKTAKLLRAGYTISATRVAIMGHSNNTCSDPLPICDILL